MALTSQSELVKRNAYKYIWSVTPGDNPHITGRPDSGRVSKTEGYEVVDFINAFGRKHTKLQGTVDAYKVEDMLHTCKEVMRKEATSWIETNWAAWQGR